MIKQIKEENHQAMQKLQINLAMQLNKSEKILNLLQQFLQRYNPLLKEMNLITMNLIKHHRKTENNHYKIQF